MKRGIFETIMLFVILPSSYALELPFGQGTFDSANSLFTQGKVLLFLSAWLATGIIVWKILMTLINFAKRGLKQDTATTGYSNIIIFTICLLFSYSTTLSFVLNTNPEIVRLITWLGLIIGYTVAEILNVLAVEGKDDERLKVRTLATVYFGVSLFLAPFMNVFSGSGLLLPMVIHGAIAYIGIFIGLEKLVVMEEKKKKRKAIEDEDAEWERKYQRDLKRTEDLIERGLVMTEHGLKWVGKETPGLNRLTEDAASATPNFAPYTPLLMDILNNLPEVNKSLIMITDFDEESRIKRVEEHDKKRTEYIRRLKEDYLETTRPGEEVKYLMTVIKDLKADPKNWIKYVSGDGGKTWGMCTFADKIYEFKNPGYQYWEEELRKTTENGSKEKAIKLMKRRLIDLNKQRKSWLNILLEEESKTEAQSNEKLGKLREEDEQKRLLKKKIAEYNENLKRINENFAEVRSNISIVLKEENTVGIRRSSVFAIQQRMINATRLLNSLKQEETEMNQLVKKAMVTSEEIEKTSKIISKLSVNLERFEREFGIPAGAVA